MVNFQLTSSGDIYFNLMEERKMDPNKVIVTNIRMPFWSMVRFMVKWSIASIPAMIILTTIIGVLYMSIMGVMGVIEIVVR